MPMQRGRKNSLNVNFLNTETAGFGRTPMAIGDGYMTRILGPRDESWLTGREWESTGFAQAAAPFALPGDRPHYLQDRNVDIDHIKLTVSFDLDKNRSSARLNCG